MSASLWFLDEIRDAVNSPQTADAESLREASAAYNEACRQANARLRDVDRLLQRGLRSEAIQLAEQEPPLMDLVAELDFSFLEEWQGIVAQWGMQLPPQLERDISARLNAAYAELRPLEQLLRRHRILALARAPLAARIDVLRQISARDELNFSWKEDLAAFEGQRFRQIRSEAAEARRSGDLSILEQLRDELAGSAFISAIPPEVVQEVEAHHQAVHQQDGRQTLEQLAPELDRAYSEFDFERGSALANRWHEVSSSIELGPADPLASRVTEALQWIGQQQEQLAEQREFQKCLEALESMLEDHAPAQKLESRLLKAERFGRPIPNLLRNRVAERLTVLHAQSRRRQLLVGSVTTLAIVILTAATFYHWHNLRGRDMVSRHVENMSSLIGQEKWQSALTYYKELPPAMQQAPELMDLNAGAREGQRVEDERAATVGKLLESAEAMDLGSPDYELLERTKSLAKTEEEKRRLADVEFKVRSRQRELQKATDEAFLDTVTKWSKRLADLERHDNLDDVNLHSTSEELYNDLRQHPKVTASLRTRGELLTSKLRALIAEKDQFAEEHAALESLAKLVGRPDDYVAALDRLVEHQPKSTAAAHARQVLDEKDAWLAVYKWAGFWNGKRSTWCELGPDEADEVLKSGEALQANTLKNELSLAFEDRKPHLKSVVARKGIDLTTLKSLLIQSTLVNGVWVVVDPEGRRDYSPKEPVKDTVKAQLRFEHFVDYSNTRSVSRQLQFVKSYGLSPQAHCANQFAAILSGLGNANWDVTFGKMAVIVRNQIETDPPLDEVLALDMLRRILQTGSSGSAAFRKTFSAVNDEIENSGVDLAVAWFLPKDKDADTARRDAGALIRGLPDFKQLGQKLLGIQQRESLPPSDQIEWIGMLDRDGAGNWYCQPSLDSRLSGTLLVAATGSPGSVRLNRIADVRSGVVKWREIGKDVTLLIGAPLFLRTDAPKTH